MAEVAAVAEGLGSAAGADDGTRSCWHGRLEARWGMETTDDSG